MSKSNLPASTISTRLTDYEALWLAAEEAAARAVPRDDPPPRTAVPCAPTPRARPSFHSIDPHAVPPPHATMDERTMFVRLAGAETLQRVSDSRIESKFTDGATQRTEVYCRETVGLWSLNVV